MSYRTDQNLPDMRLSSKPGVLNLFQVGPPQNWFIAVAIVTQPRTYDRRGVRAIVTHRGPTTGGGGARCVAIALKKEDKYASTLMLRQTPDRALKNRTVRLKPDTYLSSFLNPRPPGRVSAPPRGARTPVENHCSKHFFKFSMLIQVNQVHYDNSLLNIY